MPVSDSGAMIELVLHIKAILGPRFNVRMDLSKNLSHPLRKSDGDWFTASEVCSVPVHLGQN